MIMQGLSILYECPMCGYQLTDKELLCYLMKPILVEITAMDGTKTKEYIKPLDDDITIEDVIKEEIRCRNCCQITKFIEVTNGIGLGKGI